MSSPIRMWTRLTAVSASLGAVSCNYDLNCTLKTTALTRACRKADEQVQICMSIDQGGTVQEAATLAQLLKKKNHYIFSSHLRADQMPGPPWEGQLICTLFLGMRQ